MKRKGAIKTKWNADIDVTTDKASYRVSYSMSFCKNGSENAVSLDVGCGNGNFLYFLNQTKTVGIDLEMTALLIAKKSCVRSEFVQASAISLPFRRNIFSRVFAWEVIEHVPKGSEVALLSEISRTLKGDGIFSFSTPSDHPLCVLLDPGYFLKGHRHYNLQELSRLLLTSGFKLRKKQ